MLQVLWVASALSAEAQCPLTAAQQCFMRVEPEFGKIMVQHTVYGNALFGAPFLPHEAEHVCHKDRNDQLNHCGINADFRFTITEPEEFAGMHMAMRDFGYQPFVDSQHMDQTHPKHKVEFEVVPPDFGSPNGCDPAEWANTDVDGNVMITHVFGCWSFHKIQAAQRAGKQPAAYIMSGYDSGEELFTLSGPVGGLEEVPGHMGAGALWFITQEVTQAGGKVKGYFELKCPTGDEEPFPAREYTDGCPDDRLVGVCNDQPEPENRLCNKCPLQLKFDGGAGPEKVCLYGARLLPTKAKNFIQNTVGVGNSVEVVYIALMPWEGCAPQNFAHPGIAGKVVAFVFQGCMISSPGSLAAVRYAEKSGATGVIFMHKKPTGFMLNGPSQLHNIPVHTVGGGELPTMEKWFLESGAPLDATSPHKVLTLHLVDEDVAPAPKLPPTPPTVAPRPVVEEDTAAFEATPGAIVSIVLIVLLTVAIPAKIVADRSKAMKMEMVGEKVTGIPLSVASMLLSVSLLVIVTLVACALSASAAQEATDAAAANGQRATDQTYSNAVDNVDKLSVQLRAQTMGQVSDRLDVFLGQGFQILTGVGAIMGQWDGSWADFRTRFETGFGFLIGKGVAPIPGWHSAVKTTNQFYADSKWVNDFGYNDPTFAADARLNATNDGTVTGIAEYRFSPEKGFPLLYLHWHPHQLEESPTFRVGGEIADPIEIVKDMKPGQFIWRVAPRGVPFNGVSDWLMPWLSVTLVQPFFSPQLRLLGSLTAAAPVTTLHGELKAIAMKQKSMENVTILLYDKMTEKLVGSTHHIGEQDVALRKDHFYALSVQTPHYQIRTIRESLNLVDNALYEYLQKRKVELEANAGSLSGEFDQAEYYGHPDLHALNLGVGAGGVATDKSPGAYVVDMRGGCGDCVASDATHGNVLTFDGSNALFVDLNLTTEVPYVRDTRIGGGAGWDSSEPVYKYAMPIPGTDKMCIYRNTTFNWFGFQCSLRSNADFYLSPQYTVSARIKPAATVASTDKFQKVFEVATQGSSAMTLYASGAMVIATQEGVCVVLGVEIPGGVWSTVVAQKDQLKERCYVYVNGTLSGLGVMLGGEQPPDAPIPLTIGRDFTGHVEHVRIFHYLAEPADLHRHGEYRRSTPSRKWFFDVTPYNKNPGLDWVLTVRLPREDVMRDVDANNVYLTTNLKQEEENNQAKLDRDLAETILISAMVVLISVMVFLVFNDLLTGPFAAVAVVMCDAAVMRIEEIPDEKSMISDMNAMQAAMRLMLANLKEYKSYMPQSVILDDDDDESVAEESVATTMMTQQTGASNVSQKKKPAGGNASRSQSRSRVSKSSLSSRSKVAAKKTGGLMAVGLTKKKISLAVVNAVGWLKKVKDMGLPEVCKEHAEMAQAIVHVFAAKKGVPETFSGDRFVCSFNAAKPVGTHKVNAATSVVEIVSNSPHMLSCAVSGGEAKVGNLGTDMMKKFSFVGPLFSWVACLERYAKKIGCGVLVDGQTCEDVKTSFLTRNVDQVLYPKLKGEKKIMVSQIVKVKESGETDEWMYELEEAEKADPFHAWNQFAAAVFSGDFATALEQKDKASEVQQNADVAECPPEIFQKLLSAAERGEWQPITLEHN